MTNVPEGAPSSGLKPQPKMPQTVFLLGPQRPTANLANIVDRINPEGPIVTITAGWREGEGEVEEIEALVGRGVQDLGLYQRTESVFAQAPELRALHRARQDRLKDLQRLYQIRLRAYIQAARDLYDETVHSELLDQEQRAAINQIRALDRHHTKSVAAIHQRFESDREQLDIPIASAEREEVHDLLSRSSLVLIAGGHAAVLLNRIRLFSLRDLLSTKAIVGWSAGAMVLAQRVVLFHDDAPQGRRDAEILDTGLGIARSVVVLPHAKTRLDWSRPTRMTIFARRFSPAACVALDSGTSLEFVDGKLSHTANARRINRSGRAARMSF